LIVLVLVLPNHMSSPDMFNNLQVPLVEEWYNISQQELTNLLQSMRMRWTGYLKEAGVTPYSDWYFCWWTHYF